jgi:hypothetical protein
MGGGVIQLVTLGSQDQFISGSPDISFFKFVYKRHTNFSMESVRQTFNTKPVLDVKGNMFTCRINRVADLLQDVYLSIELPKIFSSDKFRFRWIENIGMYILANASIRIDTQLIDQIWGEWMDIWNELTLSADKREGYNKLTGNVDEFMNPVSPNSYMVFVNNNVALASYPIAGKTVDKPSIKNRRLYIPLPFWFTKNPGLAIPLVALQYQNIDITVELRSVEDLYQIYNMQDDTYYSPAEYRKITAPDINQPRIVLSAKRNDDFIDGYANNDVSIERFLVPLSQSYLNMSSSIDVDAYIECNFVFLDESERKTIALQSNDYLVERIVRIDKEGIGPSATIDLVLQNPVKEIIWIARRDDTARFNSWANFTNSVRQIPNNHILHSAKLIWNGMERFEEKSPEYFNYIQPYRHHTRCPRDGIYVYSFALYPEKTQPSGSFNASTINKIQMYVTTNPPVGVPSYNYEIVFYAVYYNIFRVMSGSGGMVFAN